MNRYRLTAAQERDLRQLEEKMDDDYEGFKNRKFLDDFRQNIKSFNRGDTNKKEIMEFINDASPDENFKRHCINYFGKYGRKFNLE